MPYQTHIVDKIRAAGLKVVTLPGWESRGSSRFNPKGVIAHHTATGPNWTDAKVNRLLRDGRPGLSGPLSQFGLGRDGTVYVIAAGRANHAGKGKWTKMSGNTSAWGIEAFNSGLGEEWSHEQMNAYIILTSVLLKDCGGTYADVAGHKEFALPRGRKPDPAGIDMEQFRMQVRTVMAGGKLKPFDPTDPAMRPTVKRGSTGVHVQNVQTAVGAGADGAFGPGTEAKVKAWQSKHGLPANGVFDLDDWSLLLGASEKPSPAPKPPTPTEPRMSTRSQQAVARDAEGEALTPDEVKFVKAFVAEADRWDVRPSSYAHILRWFRWARSNGKIDGKSYLRD